MGRYFCRRLGNCITELKINNNINKKTMEEFNFQSSMGLNFANFDPSAIQSSETINVTFVIDRSGSVSDYVDDLNNVLNDFLHELQRSHVSDRVMMQIIEFDSQVEVKSAFHPIADVKDFNITPRGCTALYAAMLAGLENAVAYKEEQENNGLSSKSLVFLITDGLENCGGDPNKVKAKINEIYKDEQNSFAFSIIMFGLGETAGFENARDDMGIRPEMMATLGTTAKELRKMVNFISSSVSSSASGATVSAVTF